MRLEDEHNDPCQIDQKRLAEYAAGVLASLDTTLPADIVANRPRL